MSLDDLNREQKRNLRRMGALDEKGAPTRVQRQAAPKRDEVIRYSIVVVITVVVYASLVGGLDALFTWLFSRLYG